MSGLRLIIVELAELVMNTSPFKVSQKTRVIACIAMVAIVAVFVIATQLTPDRKGFGTHRQLGLPACRFRQFTGLNCPQCGMTTSFAHIVRGQAVEAWRANPCGLPLAFILAGGVLPWCVVAVVTGRSVLTDRPEWIVVQLAGLYVVFATGIWVIRSNLFW